ncbi:MAG: S41 family peptidase [Marinifilaceae bacterium]|jgi:carboxyl-terminal processing protease|nr:S41 family peptidase [Marinifilaceae bacterium]
MNLRKRFLTIFISALLIVGSIGFWSFNRDDKNFEIQKNLNILATMFRELNLFYVDDIDYSDLIKKGMDSMLSSLDPYTTYISEEDMEDFKMMTTGEYAGIGSLISKNGENVVVAEPYEGFPAMKAGLKAGDIFVEINGVKIKNKTTEDVSNLLKGQANTKLNIKVKRPYLNKVIDIKLLREKIQLKSVPYYNILEDSIAYIQLNQFTNKAASEIKSALKEMNPKGLVLDLRGNPGGLLDQAIDIVNLFVEKGETVVTTKGKIKKWEKEYKSTKTPFNTQIPIAVLVNSGSASASEIVSGAIQDLDRGVVIGTRTFGKGLVQATRNLSYNTKLKVTTAKYYIPSGRCIQALDYSHRNEDGSVGKIPDSLITKYNTRNGRIVYDGGGIMPDIEIESETISNLSINLLNNRLFFDYATKFVYENETIPTADKFEISDKIFDDFRQFAKNKKFEYKSVSTITMKKLKKIMEKEKCFDVSNKEYEALLNKIQPDFDRDFDRFKTEISELLGHEIVKRYYNQVGGRMFYIKSDKIIKEAVNVLKDTKKYNRIIEGKEGEHAKNKK